MIELPQSKKSKKARAAQDFLTIKTIRDGIIILKDGSYRMVLMASAFNFGLKSADEQDAIIYQFQNFLNSIDFPLQIAIHSRKLNIEPYLENLKEFERSQENDLLKIQTAEYIEFVRHFVEAANVVTKTFYIVVPFSPSAAEKAGFSSILSSLFSTGANKNGNGEADETFNEYKVQLLQRADSVQLGLQRFGVRTVILKTEELIELYYGLYNMQELDKQKAAKQEVMG